MYVACIGRIRVVTKGFFKQTYLQQPSLIHGQPNNIHGSFMSAK